MDTKVAFERFDKSRRAAAPKTAGLVRASDFETGQFYSHQMSFLNRLRARTTKHAFIGMFGISQMEWRILVQLEYRSPSKIAEIHARSLIQKPQLSSAMPRLIRMGYVVRVDDPNDARAPNFAITEEGMRVYRRVLKVSRKRQRGLESLLTKQERKGFEAALKRLIDFHLEEMQAGRDGMFIDSLEV